MQNNIIIKNFNKMQTALEIFKKNFNHDVSEIESAYVKLREHFDPPPFHLVSIVKIDGPSALLNYLHERLASLEMFTNNQIPSQLLIAFIKTLRNFRLKHGIHYDAVEDRVCDTYRLPKR